MARDLEKALEKKGGLTLAQLASYDDVLTDALVDRLYFWSTIRKNRARFAPSRGISEEEVAGILREYVVVGKDAKEATDRILQLSGIRKYVDRLKTADEKEHFQRHLRKYVNIYLPDCPFEVTTTNRYTIDTQEASVTARREIRKGEIIKYLSGIQVAITEAEFKKLDDVRLDFSIVHSSRKKTPSLFLGPARFANHDCSANARLSTTGSHGMQIIAAKDIQEGQEITVTYGTDYFGEDNCECLCSTCEKKGRNGWAKHTGETEDEDADAGEEEMEEPEKIENAGVSEGYALRRKRKSHVLEEEDVKSGTSTPQAGKRRKVDLTPKSSQGSRDATPRGRRTIREVKVKAEHPLATSLDEFLPGIVAQSQAHLQAEVTVEVEPHGRSIRTRVSRLRESSGESTGSRSTSALSSIFSAPSNGASSASSDEDMADNMIERTPQKPLKTYSRKNAVITRTLDMDVNSKSTLLPAEVDRNESDSELTAISFCSSDSAAGRSRRLPKAKTKKLWNRELNALRQGSMERSMIAELEGQQTNTTSTAAVVVLTTETDVIMQNSRVGRYPGDFTLTAKLLTGAYSRWVTCQTCPADFVQEDAYLTRKECPRCERHSKLYGYQWPKTDREGRHDKEERILDHREVHRFVEFSEEKAIRKGGKKSTQIERLRVERSSKSCERGESAGIATPGVEGSPRKMLRGRRSRLTM